ncbi:G-protein coupled receptor Mth2-like [Colletes gigas]|uniref:G-protein coupled receptor Mth2-like n=1 Tax=Colletes gigas TaxID=935657 RepID=UPI001C9AFBB9|nr:G-protein coupled receptor Mth2-like [Colletes gigas]
MFSVDHGRITILTVWLLSMRSVFPANVTSSQSHNFTRIEYSIVETITASGESDSLVDDVRRHDGAGHNATNRYFSGSLDNAEKTTENTLMLVGNRSNVAKMTNSNRVLVPLCCPLGMRVSRNGCIQANGIFRFPPIYDSNSFALLAETPDRDELDFYIRDPCEAREAYNLDPDKYPTDAFMFLDNGTIYKQTENHIIEQTEYCFGIVDSDTYNVILCFDEEDNENVIIAFPVGLIVSAPFLFATFLVYTMIPELKNMHGFTLRGYVGSLLVAYVMLATIQITPQERISNAVCVAFAFIIHFSFLASFFWLNVMCFDIWWTFGGFRSLQGSVKQRERKKFIIYSIYAWGCASLLTGVCAIMDFVPNIPDHFIRPQFGEQSCWFTTNEAKAIYFYGPMGVTVICNICLFVSTALKIVQHKQDMAHQFKGVDSRRHDDNKQWFNLYLKLFIVMGINWSMEIVSWLCNNSPAYIWYLTDLTNTLQGVIIFLIFVWKDKIKRLLLKRFGCRGTDVLSRNSTRSAYHSSASRTCTTSAAPLQEKFNLYVSEPSRTGRPTFDKNDCA